LLIHDVTPYRLKIEQNKPMLPRCLRENLIRPRAPYDGLRRSLGLRRVRILQKHQKEIHTFDLVGGDSSLLETVEVNVLTAEPSQFGGVGEALLNLLRLTFWG